MAIENENGSKHAAPGDVEDWIYNNKASHLECRVKHHNMGYPNVVENEDGTFTQTERCRRCGTRRTEDIDAEGYTMRVKYTDHPEDYLLPKGTGRIDRSGNAILRRARVQDLLAKKAGRR